MEINVFFRGHLLELVLVALDIVPENEDDEFEF